MLVVDDDPIVARAVARFFRRYFREVLVAHNVEAAEALLHRASNVTHVVCDHFFGEGQRRGLDVLPVWRLQFPCIQVAVLLSGSELGRLVISDGIDAFISKPPDVGELSSVLGVATH